MDGSKFDDLTRRFVVSRRGALRLMAGGMLGAAGPLLGRSTGSAQGKIAICHATGSGSNPWTYIEVSNNGNNPHSGHGGDVIGVDLSSNPNHCGACGHSCDDGDPCTIDTCIGGTCVYTLMDCSGSSDQCNTGVCSGGQCGKAPVADGTGCEDGNACTAGDSCQGGSCQPGAAVVCEAPNECHIAGVCDPATGCPAPQPKEPGTACGRPATCDGNVAFSGDSCDNGGNCAPGTSTECGAGQECINAQCQNTCKDLQEACTGHSDCCNGLCQDVSGCGTDGQTQCCVGAQAQCNGECDCCDPYSCIGGSCCVNTQGGACDDQRLCCAGFQCLNKSCQPETCGFPSDGCNAASDCCQDEPTDCRVQVCDALALPRCCHPDGGTCDPDSVCDCCPGLECISGHCGVVPTCGSIGEGCIQSQCCGNLVCVGTPDPNNPFDVCVGQTGEPCRSVGNIQPFPGPIFTDRTNDCNVFAGLTCGESLVCTACSPSGQPCLSGPEELLTGTCCGGSGTCINGFCP